MALVAVAVLLRPCEAMSAAPALHVSSMKNLRWLNRQLETLDDSLARRNERPPDHSVCRQDMVAWRNRFEAHKEGITTHY